MVAALGFLKDTDTALRVGATCPLSKRPARATPIGGAFVRDTHSLGPPANEVHFVCVMDSVFRLPASRGFYLYDT